MNRKITQICCNQDGMTSKIAKEFSSFFDADSQTLDINNMQFLKIATFSDNDFVIMAMPSFTEQSVDHCSESLQNIKGSDTPALVLAAYENREYDNALLDLSEKLSENGFVVLGTETFITKQSIFTKNTLEQSDLNHQDMILQLAKQYLTELKLESQFSNSNIKKHIPIRQSANSSCTNCDICITICPTQAITNEDNLMVKTEKCISCMACIYACPNNARSFYNLTYRRPSRFIMQESFMDNEV